MIKYKASPTKQLGNFFKKMRGDKAELPPTPSNRFIVFAWIGIFLTIALVTTLDNELFLGLLLASFGGSCLTVFGFPNLSFAQPRNVIGGHMIGALIGLLFLSLFGMHSWAIASAVASAAALMIYSGTAHPPAGANPIIVFLLHPGWEFLIFPTLIGSILIIILGVIFNNLMHKENYPKYW